MPTLKTSADDELEFQRSWTLREKHKGNPVFERMIENEFLDPTELYQRLTRTLRNQIAYARQRVPYYRDRFADLGRENDWLSAPSDLAQLPILSRVELAEHFEALRSTRIPGEKQRLSIARTSGSTGVRVSVLQTARSRRAYPILWQRQARWFRHDLSRRYARIRLPNALYRMPEGSLLPDGHTNSRPYWMYSGAFFETGDEFHFNASNSRPEQLSWIREYAPAYLMTFPGLLEELVLANDCQPLPHLESITSISATLTRAMRKRVESSFQIPVHQTYGLNEIGLVSVRCDAGRYHTHIEHAHIEIVDDDGQPVAPGETGRLLVTSLFNPAMPLFRYDTGDIAVATEGSCPCGRTSPGFQDILGRSRLFTQTPEGTRPRLLGLIDVLTHMPNEYFTNLRQYQVHQRRDKGFELRVVVRGPLRDEFGTSIRDAWGNLNQDGEIWPLTIVEVDEIKPLPNGKMVDFQSEYFEHDQEVT